MFYTSADFVTFTRKQANVVYAAHKRGDVKMTRQQVTHLYNCVGTDDFTFYGVVQFICEDRYDLAQAVLDGRKVEEYTVEIVKTEKVDEDDLFAELYAEDGYVREYTVTETRYRIVA